MRHLFVFAVCATFVYSLFFGYKQCKRATSAHKSNGERLSEIAEALRSICDTCQITIDTVNGRVMLGPIDGVPFDEFVIFSKWTLQDVPGKGSLLKLLNADTCIITNQKHPK